MARAIRSRADRFSPELGAPRGSPIIGGSHRAGRVLRFSQLGFMYTPEGFIPAHVLPAALPAGAIVFAFRGDKVLVSEAVAGNEFSPRLPTWGESVALGVCGTPHYLGALEGADCVAAGVPDGTPEPAGWRYAGLRSLFFVLPDAHLALAARAFQIVDWERTHRFCGRCGTATRDKAGAYLDELVVDSAHFVQASDPTEEAWPLEAAPAVRSLRLCRCVP